MDYYSPLFDRLQDCWDPISAEQLEALQDELESDLPDDYCEFLLRFNAGYWAHMVQSRVLACTEFDRNVSLGSTYGIIQDDRFMVDDLLHTVEVYSDRMPNTFIPIMDAMGDPVCMDLGEENYGKVYYWDRSHEGLPRKRDLLLADSFTEFLLTLRPFTELDDHEEELPAFQAVERGDHAAVVEHLMDGGGVQLRNARGWTLLMCAARNSWPRIVETLLKAGADPDARDADGWCALHHAAWCGSLDSTKHLLAVDANASYRDAKGRNLAQIAKDEHHYRLSYHLAPYMPYP